MVSKLDKNTVINDLRRLAHFSHSLCIVLLVLGSLGCLVPPSSRPFVRTPDRALVVPGEGFLKTFDNGLTLLVVPDPYARVAQLDVRHQVGRRDDPRGKEGTAHFIEHLMYEQPSAEPGSVSLFAEARANSVDFNAYTSVDETHYQYTGLPEQLDVYLRHTARRLGFDCAAIDETTLESVREIIRQELVWRRRDAGAQLREQVSAALFPDEHPYGHDTAQLDRLSTITAEDACTFATRHYTTDRATIVVTGNVDPAQVLELANAHLAGLPRAEAEPRVPVPARPLPSDRITIEAAITEPGALVLFEMPRRFSEDHTAARTAFGGATLLLSVLDEDEVPWSYLGLVGFGGKEAPVVGFAVALKEGEELDGAIDRIFEVLDEGGKLDLDEGSYDQFRQSQRRHLVDELASVKTRANAYADYLEEGDAPGFVAAELARIDRLTADAIQTSWRERLGRDRAFVIDVVPDDDPGSVRVQDNPLAHDPTSHQRQYLPDDIDPEEASRPLELVDIAPPDLELVTFETSNGMKVVLAASSQFPVIDAELVIAAGKADAKWPETAELASMLYQRYDEDGRKLLTMFYQAGGVGTEAVGMRSTSYRARGLSIYLDFIIAGLSERVVQADYIDGSFDVWKKLRLAQLEQPKYATRLESQRRVAAALYGESHPFARVGADAEELRRVRGVPVNLFRGEHYRAANASLVIAGGFDVGLVTEHVQAGFEDPRETNAMSLWNRPPLASPTAFPQIEPAWGRVLTQVDDEAVQTHISMIFPLRSVHGQWHAALNVLRTMLELEVAPIREELAATYGVGVAVSVDPPMLVITGALDRERAHEGLLALRAAISGMFARPDLPKRFAYARRRALYSMLEIQGDPSRYVSEMAQSLRHTGRVNYFYELAERYALLDLTKVETLAHRLFDNAGPITVITGDRESIEGLVAAGDLGEVQALPDVVRD